MNLCAQYLRQAEALKADMADSKLGVAEVWTSRQALQDVYQKMLVTDLEYALDKKVEQDLWNHAFKNQITTLQSQAKNRANPNRSEVQANLSLFLEAASGFYTQMLQELCTVFHVDLPCRVRSSQLGIFSTSPHSSSAIVTPQTSSCFYICQHCLVHLGDIARYRNQTSQAESYYRHAAQLVPSNGQPYNQLAILASSKGDHLTTIFYYCRSIAVKFPFPAASTNLQKALSKALESREEVKTKWSLSDFIKAFIKFHGHVYLSKSVDKLDALRGRLEEQFQRLMLQKAFTSQQLVHLTVINLFELHHLQEHLQELSNTEQSPGSEHHTCWTQLLSLFMSFLGVMCSRAILNQSESEEQMGQCPLPAIKVSLDWLRLRPGLFHQAAVHQRQHVWPWLVSLLNGFQPKEEDVSGSSVVPLPEEFELQGFLALRPSLRILDFTKGHQGALHTRHQRLVCLGKWIADTQPLLMQCRVSEDGLLTFLTDLPELPIDEPQEKEVLQESSNSEPSQTESGSSKSSTSQGKNFKENLKPREPSRDTPRSLPKEPTKESAKEPMKKGSVAAVKTDAKWDSKKKNEMKKSTHEKTSDSKQMKVQTEMRKTPEVSEVKKSPVTPTQPTGSTSQFVHIHHQGAFPPLTSCPGFPPSAYVLTPPVPFHGLQGFTFSPGPVSVSGHFLSQAPPQPNKSSHPPYTQQRSPPQGSPASAGQSQPPGPTSMGQQQALQQPPPQQVTLGKSPPHLGLQQYLQEQSSPLWSQGSGPKLPQMPPPLKPQQPQQSLFMSSESSLKQFDPQPSMPDLDKKFSPSVNLHEEQMWKYSNQAVLERLRRESQSDGPRALPFQYTNKRMEPGVESMNQPSSLLQGFPMQLNQNSMFSQTCGKNLPPSSKPEPQLMPQEPSLYSLFETSWSPSLPASSDHSTPASQSPHSSNPSSLPSSPPTHNHNTQSNYGPIGTFDSRERRLVDRWKMDKKGPGSGFGLDYLPPAPSSESSWPQSSWSQECPMEESTVLPDSLKSFWSSSMMQPGLSPLEQLLLQQQKQKQQHAHGTMNPPH
ncbi:nonsense-mediated mRNA decay factor SMG7 isoform X2 [Periophthalmus magnuspinnatus]|uniref:nonsense-mediated mRNA decay factor SMG7 isoform X2 n=1 Tax=Periophthalmus magnuspinnatus TaxID=409849 RepID=UPI00145BC56A|nr:nonsense-mediated mRNA decay factor SMG7 isoform X2 [Periophthalmus magnuspinnatus]